MCDHLYDDIVEVNDVDYNATNITGNRAQTRVIVIPKDSPKTRQSRHRAPGTGVPGGQTPHPHRMPNNDPVPLSVCIRELIEQLGCACDPRHLEAGGFDPDCPIHDPTGGEH